MNCENDLIVCIDSSNYIKNKNNTDKNNNKFKNLIKDIQNYKKLTEENIAFIKLLPHDKNLDIIIEYDKIVQKLLYDIDDLIKYKNIR
jgi:SUMO ligase MMS21 Smc5/6 complex component